MKKLLLLLMSLLFVLTVNVGHANAVPDIRGEYSGSDTTVVSNCAESGTYHGTLAISISTQTGDTFSGTATVTFEPNAIEYIQLSGTISESGQISGDTSHTFLGTGGVGTFTGQLSGNTLSIENPGHDTYGNTCAYIRYMSATREGGLTPSASFSASPTCGNAPLRVNFTDESSGAITSWNWNFGDGTSSVIQNPSHTYTSDGKYSVSLTVSGPNGLDIETKTDYIFVGKISKLESTFDEGVEGWWIYGDGTNLTYHTDGGNPGGYISAVDLALDETWRFISPCTWGGDWSSFLGGTISFDLKVISGDTNRYYSASDVIIDTEGTGHYAKWSSGIDPKLGSWTHYEVRLSESNFEIIGDRTWDQIISNVTYLLIRGEHIVGPDTEGIDNIRVLPSPELFSIAPILQLLLDDE